MRSLVTDATPYKQGLRESLDFGSFLSANRTPNVRLVKFSDAGLGAMAGRARCWSPALENLPRTKPRGAVAAPLWEK
jgi:hypothetical protein